MLITFRSFYNQKVGGFYFFIP